MRPPRAAEWLASRLLPEAAREQTIGDLHERFADRVARLGAGPARRWYVRQVLGFALALPAAWLSARLTAHDGRAELWTGLATDGRDAMRAVIRQPALTAAVVLILGLAVGAVTTVAGVIDGVLLKPLPFASPDELVMIWDEYPGASAGGDPRPVSLRRYRAWRAQEDVFAAAGAYELIPAAIDTGRWPERIDAALVTASLLPALGARPALGRLFTPEDDVAGAPRVAIVSDDLWRSHLGGDPAIMGRSIPIDGEPTEIVGVMPPDFWFYDPYAATRSYTGTSASAARLWRPLAGRFADDVDYPRYRVIARLRPGVSRATASSAVAAVDRALGPDVDGADGRVRVLWLSDQVVGEVRPQLLALLAAVSLVLVVAAVNLVGLLVARLEAQRVEFAVRAALGAGRARIARALMLHGAILALAGGAFGLWLASVALPRLLDLVPRGLPLAHRVGLDARLALFAMLLSVAVGVVITGFAALRLGPSRLMPLIASQTRRVAGSVISRRLSMTMVGAEVALSLVLLISATLLLRSLVSVHRTDAGFDARDVLTFESLLMLQAPGAPPDFAFFDRLEARLADVSGVVSAGSASVLPFSRRGQSARVRVEGSSPDAPSRETWVDLRLVSPGYFETLRIDAVAGRLFAPDDRAGAPAVAIVNRAFVERLMPASASPVGVSIGVARGRSEVERAIVGVVGNVKEVRLIGDARPIVYVPIAQLPMPFRQFVVRTSVEPAAFVEPLRRTAAALDPSQPLQAIVPLETLVAQSIEDERFYATIAAVFAAIAVGLALAGLYAAVSFSVRQRDREVGVRIALGARPSGVYRLVLREGLRPVVAGIALGCLVAAGTSQLLRALLHDVPELDPLSYAMSAATFLGIATLACVVPARRAAAIDPIRTLQQS